MEPNPTTMELLRLLAQSSASSADVLAPYQAMVNGPAASPTFSSSSLAQLAAMLHTRLPLHTVGSHSYSPDQNPLMPFFHHNHGAASGSLPSSNLSIADTISNNNNSNLGLAMLQASSGLVSSTARMDSISLVPRLSTNMAHLLNQSVSNHAATLGTNPSSEQLALAILAAATSASGSRTSNPVSTMATLPTSAASTSSHQNALYTLMQTSQAMSTATTVSPTTVGSDMNHRGRESKEDPSPTPPASKRPLSEREQFLVFIKILFRCLETEANQQLRQIAKAVVTDCTRRNRSGEAEYTPLQVAVEIRLRPLVGERIWHRAQRCFAAYCRKQGWGPQSTRTSPAPTAIIAMV